MARTEIESLSYGFDYPVNIACPIPWLKAEESWIRIKQISRASEVGVTDISKNIVRAVSGRFWLSNSGYLQATGLIEFQAQEIYYDKELWNAEITSQNYANELSTIDLDINGNIDEAVLTYLYLGELAAQIIGSLNLPFISDLNEWIANLVADISSDDINYYPSPHRPDTITIWIPEGLVDIEIEFLWRSFSPIAILGGVGEFPIEDLIQSPNLPQNEDLFNEIPVLTFDQRARERGYILESECSVIGGKFLIKWNVISSDCGGATLGFRSIVVTARRITSIGVPMRYSPSNTAPVGNYVGATLGISPCSDSQSISPIPSNDGMWYVSSIAYVTQSGSNALAYVLLFGSQSSSCSAQIEFLEALPCQG